MGAEVSGSLRRTPSRPPRSALGLDGVGTPRLAPAARLASRVRQNATRPKLADCVAPNCNLAPKGGGELRPDFFGFSEAENLQGGFAGEGKGLARRAARPALAIITTSVRDFASMLGALCVRRPPLLQSRSYEYPLVRPSRSQTLRHEGVDGNIHTNWLAFIAYSKVWSHRNRHWHTYKSKRISKETRESVYSEICTGLNPRE